MYFPGKEKIVAALSKFSVHFRFFFFIFLTREWGGVFCLCFCFVCLFFDKNHSQILIRLKDNVRPVSYKRFTRDIWELSKHSWAIGGRAGIWQLGGCDSRSGPVQKSPGTEEGEARQGPLLS